MRRERAIHCFGVAHLGEVTAAPESRETLTISRHVATWPIWASIIFLKRSFIIIIIIIFIIFIPESFHFSGLSQCMSRFLCYVASVVSVAQMLGISLPQSIDIYRNKSRRLATRLRYLLTRIASSLFTCFKDLYESWNNLS